MWIEKYWLHENSEVQIAWLEQLFSEIKSELDEFKSETIATIQFNDSEMMKKLTTYADEEGNIDANAYDAFRKSDNPWNMLQASKDEIRVNLS